MTISQGWHGGALLEIDHDECYQLLTSKTTGRLAFLTPDGPMILPVNHITDGTSIRFRTSPHNSISRHVQGKTVAFEVDEVDSFTESGWSVVLRGVAELVLRPQQGVQVPPPWPEGIRSAVIEIRPLSITGRRVLGH